MTVDSTKSPWPIYFGDGRKPPKKWNLPAPPPWRPRRATKAIDRALEEEKEGDAFVPSKSEIDAVNAALFLRRPLLVTGKPGVGKSSLARAVARELELGSVLWWPITTRTTLQDGLYRYDALARLQEVSHRRHMAPEGAGGDDGDISKFLRLGPLGTALLPGSRPRVLLVDEIDKGDVDLPNELLHVFEEGRFEIPELARLDEAHRRVRVRAEDGDDLIEIEKGVVASYEFPLVILTSNGERDFPPAFMRRCIRVEMKAPTDAEGLGKIVAAHLGSERANTSKTLIDNFMQRNQQDLATDQLLNAIYVATYHEGLEREELIEVIFKNLRGVGST
jgi:MoxR-like ATPase